MKPEARSQWIKEEANRLGFLACGIAKADFLAEEASKIKQWIAQGRAGEMSYMTRNLDKRLDPRRLVPGAKSLIVLLYNYSPPKDLFTQKSLKIARYAYGADYHYVLRAKLQELFAQIRKKMGHIEGRVFTDSAPVHERAWAERAGLGWIGKNQLLLRKGVGSFFFIGEIICALELAYDAPATDHCGSCRACVDSCPTEALFLNGEMDPRRCISYQTIERKTPSTLKAEEQSGWIFGCDICQEVCPWNRFSVPHTDPQLEPLEGLANLPEQLEEMSKSTFDQKFGGSPLQRAGYDKLRHNIQQAQRQTR